MCKTIDQLCRDFEYLNYVLEERYLVCNLGVTYPQVGGIHVPG